MKELTLQTLETVTGGRNVVSARGRGVLGLSGMYGLGGYGLANPYMMTMATDMRQQALLQQQQSQNTMMMVVAMMAARGGSRFA
jgi:hypothetical protein